MASAAVALVRARHKPLPCPLTAAHPVPPSLVPMQHSCTAAWQHRRSVAAQPLHECLHPVRPAASLLAPTFMGWYSTSLLSRCFMIDSTIMPMPSELL
jgi:hypothetical protein